MTVRNNNAQFVSHKKSNRVVDGKPKLPSSNDLHEGEIAINFAEGFETLSIKNESGDVVTFSSDNYYSEQKLGSAFTGANSAVTVTEALEGIGNEVEVNSGETPTTESIELWIDESQDPAEADVYTKAEVNERLNGKVGVAEFDEYSGTVATELSGKASQDDMEAISGVTTAHTANTDIHVTAEDKTAWNAKADASAITDFFDAVEYDSSGKTIDFYHDGVIVDSIDVTDFIKDGMVNDVKIDDVLISGETVTCLVVTFNTDAGKEDINIPVTEMFDPDVYYTKSEIDDIVSGINQTIEDNEEIVATALNDLEERKMDISSYTESEIWVDGTGLHSAELKGGDNNATGNYSVAEGSGNTAVESYSHAEGRGTIAYGASSHAEGTRTFAYGTSSHAEGDGASATTSASHAEGHNTIASGQQSHAEGESTSATSFYTHAEGQRTLASGGNSHAEGLSTTANSTSSHAEGTRTTASGDSSHVEGKESTAFANYSHAEGYHAYAYGEASHAEGDAGTSAIGPASHAEGSSTKASGACSHAEGNNTKAIGNDSHTEGFFTVANNPYEHASGTYNISNSASTEFGHSGNTLFSVGNGDLYVRHNVFEIRQNGDIYINSGNTEIKLQDNLGGGGGSITVDQVIDSGTSASTNAVSTSAVYGFVTSYTPSITVDQTIDSTTSGSSNPVATKAVYSAITENERVVSRALNDLDERKLDASAYTPTEELWVSGTGENSVAQKGGSNVANATLSVAEGDQTSALTYASHSEGQKTLAKGFYSHAEGHMTTATTGSSHAEGEYTLASGSSSHAEGWYSIAGGSYSHAEGSNNYATGMSSHAEGASTVASGGYSHTEGQSTSATSLAAHSEGRYTIAKHDSSHAEGYKTSATTIYSHTEGESTIAKNTAEHASGRYNVSNYVTTEFGNSGNTLFSVGNGTADNARHNAFEIRQNGDIYIVSGGTDIKLQDHIGGGGSITVDQVLDNTTSASTNPVSSKAVYDAVTDNELVWTNAYVTISGAISSHTEDASIHITAADRTKLNSITGTLGSMAYENTSSYSSATEVSNALGAKVNSATYTGHTADTNVHITAADRTKIDGIKPSIVSAVTVSSNLSNVTCPADITGSTNTGAQAIVIYENGGSTTDYTITASTTYKTPDGSQISLTCPKSGYCEISYLNINGTIYARGV